MRIQRILTTWNPGHTRDSNQPSAVHNATIAAKLVPAVHEAAGRRQTIVVTQNANLAIVGDADQIIHCQAEDRNFSISGGSIAELDIARFALDVLEGTKPAFDNRRHKYEAFPELA